MKKFTNSDSYRLSFGKTFANVVVKKWFSNSVMSLKISRQLVFFQRRSWNTKHREAPTFEDFVTLNESFGRLYQHLEANECIKDFRVYSTHEGLRFVTLYDDKVVTVSKFVHGKAVSFKVWFDTCIEDIAVHWPGCKLETFDKDTLDSCQETDINVAGIFLNTLFNGILR